jgi:uncharacterized protein (TIGR04255 family)
MMSLEEQEYQKLNKQPLSLVLAEFRFSEVRKMVEYIPDIQEKLRRDYPAYEEGKSQSVRISPEGVAIDHQVSRWIFGAQDGSRVVVISENNLVFVSTDYGRFEGYEDGCISVVKVLLDIVEPQLLMRVGLRYNDVVYPINEGDTLNQYVIQELCMSNKIRKIGNRVVQNRTESTVETDEGVLTVRSIEGMHELVTMPDLNNMSLVSLRKDIPDNKPRVILDFDHIWHDKIGEKFELEVARYKLRSLHKVARKAFWDVTTKFAREERWQ